MERARDVLLILIFSSAMCFPHLDRIFHLDPSAPLEEKRELAAPPKVSLNPADFRSFPARFDEYYRDHFGFRRSLIRAHHILMAKFLGVSPSKSVLIGKKGWLFYNEDAEIEDYLGYRQLSEEELAAWQRSLEWKEKLFAQKGARYIFLLAPHKPSIYPEYLPGFARRIRTRTRQDQLVAYLKAHSDVQILDLRPALLEAKSRRQLYWKNDTHWNNAGACVAYLRILRQIQQWFPDVQAFAGDQFQIEERVASWADLAALMAMRDDFPETGPYFSHPSWKPLDLTFTRLSPRLDPYTGKEIEGTFLVYRGNCLGRRLRIMLIGDSFADYLSPFLYQHAGYFVWIAERLHPSLLNMWMDKEHPDIVIEECAEHVLGRPPL